MCNVPMRKPSPHDRTRHSQHILPGHRSLLVFYGQQRISHSHCLRSVFPSKRAWYHLHCVFAHVRLCVTHSCAHSVVYFAPTLFVTGTGPPRRKSSHQCQGPHIADRQRMVTSHQRHNQSGASSGMTSRYGEATAKEHRRGRRQC